MQGTPQEPGRSSRLPSRIRAGELGHQPQARVGRAHRRRERMKSAGRVLPSEGTKRGGTVEGKSELFIVPRKRGNASQRTPWREGRAGTTEPLEGKMSGPQTPASVSTKLQRIAELARKAPELSFRSLAHHIDAELLGVAYRRTRKDGAVGVDGQTAAEYSENLEERLSSLLDRFKAGTYRAPPVKRVYIPKDRKGRRPIGIPTFEDKILQRAVSMVLEAVYEQDFLDCSYGFRPGRSAHQALEAVWEGVMAMGGAWVLEIDIESYFDSIDHGHLRSFLDQRVCDGVLRRAIGKWLNAGVLEQGQVFHPESGTPQGGVISPLLANVYLHEVLDKWFEHQARPRLRGRTRVVRYADDAVIIFEHEDDARRVQAVLPKRFGKFGLCLHPDKTRLVDFRRPRGSKRPRGRSFDLLGFTHYWGKSRRGNWVVKRKTMSSRFSRALRAIREWCSRKRHAPIGEQHRQLCMKVRGHYAYYGVTGNGRALRTFVRQVERAWRKWLDRRSGHAKVTWARFRDILRRHPLPPPRIVHSALRHAAKP
jgi:RNA-directed DNA polymerase